MGHRLGIGNIDLRNVRPFNWSAYWANRYPSDLWGEVASETSLTLYWINNGTLDYTGHKVYISTDKITFTLNKTITSIGTSTTVTGLTAGARYYFYIIAYKDTHESGISNIIDYRISTLLTGLVAGWKFDETVGNAADVKETYTLINNGVATYVTGVMGRAVSMGATNISKYLGIDDNFGLAYNSPRSMSAWINIINVPGAGDFTFCLFDLLFAGNPGNTTRALYRRLAGVFKLAVYTGTYNTTLTPGTWYHIALTLDHVANEAILYLNGVPVITTTSYEADYSIGYTSNLAVGVHKSTSLVYYASEIADDLYLWNRVLTPTEVTEISSNYEGYLFPYFPKMDTVASPSAGERVKVNLAGWNAAIYHSLYLPQNYSTDRTWPIIIDLPGNANHFENGLPDGDCYLGWGLSKGVNFIWALCPFINTAETAMAPTWWGDGSSPTTQGIASTVHYITDLIANIVANYHGDINKVVLMGWSRGAIACGYIGCSSDVMASKFISWMPHSHHDGGTYTPAGAATRLARMLGKKTCITYGDAALDGGYANSQTGLALVQAAGVTEEHYGIVNMGHNIEHSLRYGDATVDSIRAFLAQYK